MDIKCSKWWKLFCAAVLLFTMISLAFTASADFLGENNTMQAKLQSEPIVLVVPDSSLTQATTMPQSISWFEGETIYEAMVKVFLARTRSQAEEESPFHSLNLLSIYLSNGLASVNLSGDMSRFSDKELFLLAYCLVNSLTQLDEVQYVNLLLDDKAVEIDAKPLGPRTYISTDFETAYWRETRENSETNINMMQSTVYAPLYFAANGSHLLLSEVRSVAYTTKTDVLYSIIAELAKGPVDGGQMNRVLPSTAYLSAYELTPLNANGTYSLMLRIEGSVRAYFTRNSIDPDLAVSSIVLSVMDLYPGVESVSVYFDSNAQSDYENQKRTQHELVIGSSLILYYPIENAGGIAETRRYVPSYKRSRTSNLVDEMFILPDDIQEQRIISMMPTALSRDDIISIGYNDSRATVNVTSHFIHALRNMTQQEERNAIYSIVNTLCTIRNVNSVIFFENANPCQNVTNRVNLGEPLYFNPGIIVH